ncbi:MAG: hypothetical protein ABI670_08955 [Chloroflexota bacterium]
MRETLALIQLGTNETDGEDEAVQRPTLAEIVLENVDTSVKSASTLQSAEELKDRLAATADKTYDETDPATKLVI